MAYFIIQTTDFNVGKYKLAQSVNTTPDLQEAINRYVLTYVYELLGQALGTLFVAEVNTNGGIAPTSTRMLAFYNPFNLQDGSVMKNSQGMKDWLLACVFYEYVFDYVQAKSTQAGVSISAVDTAMTAEASRFAERRFNDALETYENIRKYIQNGFNNNNVSVGGYTVYPEYIAHKRLRARFSDFL